MGLFDFLKKKEFEKIDQLNKEIESLSHHLYELKEYEGILDAKAKAQEIIGTAENEARIIISNAENEADSISSKAKMELNESQQVLLNAKNEAKEIVSDARTKANSIKESADAKMQEASTQAVYIIESANKRAEEIAGDAYRAMKEAENLETTIKALKNKLKGYGNEYLIPSYSLLDQLADDFGYAEAGSELKLARERTRLMIKNGIAAKCDYVEENRKTTAIDFITDAFNGKVDIILASAKEDNYGILMQKIKDAYNLVNNLGKPFRNALITPEYLNARLDELKWTVAAIELKNQEKEEQRRIKEQIREEERARKEIEKALRDSEKEEQLLKKAMEKARMELENASEAQKQKYEQKLAELTSRLEEAEAKGQRALSMAQQTKSGHVYIISNIGSFGEHVYKIGMTRRLEPTDRVKELGDASVPFSFDIHAMIYSENAPALETELHRCFMDQQLNKVNPRKEFFRLDIKSIREKIESMDLKTKWTMSALASEYRESLNIEKNMQNEVTRKEWERMQLEQMGAMQEDEIECLN